MRYALAAAVILSACYAPEIRDCQYECASGAQPCPQGLTCRQGVCRTGNNAGACEATASCGNGAVDPGEDCDDNDDDTDGCAGCKTARCGDGFVKVASEACDDGNTDSDDGCIDCQWSQCGDGKVRRGVEDCEPPTPGCTPACKRCTVSAPDRVAALDDGQCYMLEVAPKNWDTAQANCAAAGGHLVTLVDEAQRSELHSKLSVDPASWIGLRRTGAAAYAWVTGEPFVRSAWGMITEDMGTESCFAQQNIPWTDWNCVSETKPSVCEIETWKIDPTTVGYDNHAYKVFYLPRTWTDAKAFCEALAPGRSHLATLTSGAAAMFARQVTFVDAWIGANDLGTEGAFAWTTGEPFSFAAWGVGQPNDLGMKDCVAINPTGTWSTEPCADTRAYLCEID